MRPLFLSSFLLVCFTRVALTTPAAQFGSARPASARTTTIKPAGQPVPTSSANQPQAKPLPVQSSARSCKVVPGGPGWPTNEQWGALNTAVRGRLSKPPPPAAACHRSQPGYNAAACVAVQAGWKDADWHVNHMTSNMWQNYNNYSCMPDATSHCSSAGYPVFVVQAHEASDVKAAVDFARTYNVRLNIKSTG
jgi:hypothetical protein